MAEILSSAISHAHHHHHKKCQSCKRNLNQPLYCTACDKIQQLKETADYFEIFDQPLSYRIDRERIDEAFDDLIVALHPDFHTQDSPIDQSLSMEYTALLHEAKDRLFNPFERGKYLLAKVDPLNGHTIANPPQSFIFEMFEVQEELDEVEARGKSSAAAEKTVQALNDAIEESLELQFDQALSQSPNPKLLQAIRENLGKMKFVRNLLERIEKIKKFQPSISA